MAGAITHRHRGADHGFTKASEPALELVAGMGVLGEYVTTRNVDLLALPVGAADR